MKYKTLCNLYSGTYFLILLGFNLSTQVFIFKHRISASHLPIFSFSRTEPPRSKPFLCLCYSLRGLYRHRLEDVARDN